MKKLEEELQHNKENLHDEFEKFKTDCSIDGYLVLISFEDWYEVWIQSGKWEDRLDTATGIYNYVMCPKDGELTITLETARIHERGHYDIMNMVNDRVDYNTINQYIIRRYEEDE